MTTESEFSENGVRINDLVQITDNKWWLLLLLLLIVFFIFIFCYLKRRKSKEPTDDLEKAELTPEEVENRIVEMEVESTISPIIRYNREKPQVRFLQTLTHPENKIQLFFEKFSPRSQWFSHQNQR